MKFFNLISLFALTATIVSCGGKHKSVETIPVVKVDSAQQCGVGSSQQYPGKVVSAADANVSFKVAGTLKNVLVKEGQHVAKGQLLAELDNTDYQVQLSATQAEYAQIKAEAERVIGLYKEGGTTASNYDKARYGLQQIQAKLQNHKNQLSYTKIYAPYDGYIQEKFMDKGETVGAGMPIVSMLSSGAPEIEINLPAAAYVNRDKFSQFTCTFDVLPGEILNAEPVSVLPQANSNQLYTMRLRLLTNNRTITPGMSTWVTVHGLPSEANVVRIPTTCVLEKDDKVGIFLYDSKTETVRLVEVKVETLHTDGTVEVSGNVHPSELVVSSGVHFIKNGAKVKRMAPVSKTNVGGLM